MLMFGELTSSLKTRTLVGANYFLKRALGGKMNVGIIAVDNPDYDPKRWWLYSAGVKDVVSEGFSFLYILFFLLFAKE